MGPWPLKAKLNVTLKNQEQFHLATTTTLDEDDLDVYWLVGVGIDGASPMVGGNQGWGQGFSKGRRGLAGGVRGEAWNNGPGEGL